MVAFAVDKDFRVKNGLVVVSTATILSTASSISTTTGALQVVGGVGVGGKLYVGGLANSTSSYIVYINTTTGELSYGVNSGGSGSSVGSPFSGIFTITNTTAASSTTTGALQVAGGVGIGGGLFVGGISTVTNITTATNTTTGALQVRGGIGVADSVYVGNRVGFVGTTRASVVYQYYNTLTNSLDTVFG